MISNYRRVEYSNNPPPKKCIYCTRRTKLIPHSGYFICIWCEAKNKVMSTLSGNAAPRLRTGLYRF